MTKPFMLSDGFSLQQLQISVDVPTHLFVSMLGKDERLLSVGGGTEQGKADHKYVQPKEARIYLFFLKKQSRARVK